jgi:hypothetical protein
VRITGDVTGQVVVGNDIVAHMGTAHTDIPGTKRNPTRPT